MSEKSGTKLLHPEHVIEEEKRVSEAIHPEEREEEAKQVPSATFKEELAEIWAAILKNDASSHAFLLRVVQPGLAGLMDGSVSTLAPIFATAFVTHSSFTALIVGMAAATGAGISMAFSEGLSDDGVLTGRGSPVIRGTITGIMTFFGGALHTIPFLIAHLDLALITAYVVVAFELLLIAAIRHRYFKTPWMTSIAQVVGGGVLVFLAALLFGNA